MERSEGTQEKGLVTVLLLSTFWLIEILLLTSSQIPSYDGKWNLDMLRRIYKAMELEPPENLPC